MSVYLIAQITIEDRAEYQKYEAGFADVFRQHSGKVLSVSEDPELLEGSWACTRTVLLVFPDREQAMAWYESPEYQAIIGHRLAASSGNVVIVDQFNP
jgi:uncharacterized protein (DUF1330 family)